MCPKCCSFCACSGRGLPEGVHSGRRGPSGIAGVQARLADASLAPSWLSSGCKAAVLVPQGWQSSRGRFAWGMVAPGPPSVVPMAAVPEHRAWSSCGFCDGVLRQREAHAACWTHEVALTVQWWCTRWRGRGEVLASVGLTATHLLDWAFCLGAGGSPNSVPRPPCSDSSGTSPVGSAGVVYLFGECATCPGTCSFLPFTTAQLAASFWGSVTREAYTYGWLACVE